MVFVCTLYSNSRNGATPFFCHKYVTPPPWKQFCVFFPPFHHKSVKAGTLVKMMWGQMEHLLDGQTENEVLNTLKDSYKR